MLLVLPPDLTVIQAAIWFNQQLFPGRPIFNTGQALTIQGMLRTDLFEIALRETIAESPGLRLPPRCGPVPFDLPLLDLREELDPRLRPSNGCGPRCAWRSRWRIPRYFALR